MASNPMQKKARNSFLLGMIITLIICLIIGALFYFLILSKNKKEEEEKGVEVIAYALNTDIKSGQTITSDLLTQITVYENMIPSNYIDNTSILNMQLQDMEGNILQTTSDGLLYIMQENNVDYKSVYDENEGKQDYKKNDKDKNKVLIETQGNRYYKTRKSDNEENDEDNREYIEFLDVPVIAKVDMYKNTILTSDMVSKSNEVITDDVRYMEYNMLVLPTTVTEGDFVDIRLLLPNGLDLVVVSKKEIKSLLGDTVGLELSEDEILMMESAIVEAYIMTASKLYVTQYVEPGNQTAAIHTYTPTNEVQTLIASDVDKNIQTMAKNTLAARFSQGIRSYINNNRSEYSDTQKENIETKLQEEIENAKAAREAYLSGLTSY